MSDDTGAGRPEPELRVVDRRWWARGDAGANDDADAEPVRQPTKVEELERQIADQGARLQAALAEHRRVLDDFDQARARVRRDAAREIERARRAVILDLLEVLDNLDRAIASADASVAAPDALARGVTLVRDQFLAKLAALGVTRLESLGAAFDAARHEAVSTAPIDVADDEGRVVAVVREGYAIGDEVLRPASVIVGQGAGEAPTGSR